MVGLGGTAVALAMGRCFTCTMLDGGAIKCWGQGSSLGDGTGISSFTPVEVVGLGGPAVALSAGREHACVLLGGGAIKCWGTMSFYAGHSGLGDNTTATRFTPVEVLGLGGTAVAIASGHVHACTILDGGAIKCWGDNFYGQLGDNTTTTRLMPVGVVGLGGTAVALALGQGFSCAMLDGGAIKCWGRRGNMGDGTYTDRLTPVTVVDL